jgi:uncharacterized protein YlxP (DUF503 family)
MFVGFARYDLRLAGCTSLKDKRSVLRTLMLMLQQKFRCAVAEVAAQDMHQRASVGLSIVTESAFHARRVLSEIGRHVETHPGVEVIASVADVFAPEDL